MAKNTIPISGHTLNDLLFDMYLVELAYPYQMPITKTDIRINNERKGQLGELLFGYSLQHFMWSTRIDNPLFFREFKMGIPSPSNNHGIDYRLSLNGYPDLYVEVKNLGKNSYINWKFYNDCIKKRFSQHCHDPSAIKCCIVGKKQITNSSKTKFKNDNIHIIPINGQLENYNYRNIFHIKNLFDTHISEIRKIFGSYGYYPKLHTPIFPSLINDYGRSDGAKKAIKMNVPYPIIKKEFNYSIRHIGRLANSI